MSKIKFLKKDFPTFFPYIFYVKYKGNSQDSQIIKKYFQEIQICFPKVSNIFRTLASPMGMGLIGSWDLYVAKAPTKQLYENSIPEKGLDAALCTTKQQGFGREKDGNHGKFIGSNLVILCYKEFEKFALCKSISQSEVTFTVYSEPIVKNNFS